MTLHDEAHQLYVQQKTSLMAVYVKSSLLSQILNFIGTTLKAAGIVSKVFEHPFDLTKVRLQAQVLDANARFHGPLDCLVRTFRNEGVRGLFRVCILLPPPSSCAELFRCDRVYPLP